MNLEERAKKFGLFIGYSRIPFRYFSFHNKLGETIYEANEEVDLIKYVEKLEKLEEEAKFHNLSLVLRKKDAITINRNIWGLMDNDDNSCFFGCNNLDRLLKDLENWSTNVDSNNKNFEDFIVTVDRLEMVQREAEKHNLSFHIFKNRYRIRKDEILLFTSENISEIEEYIKNYAEFTQVISKDYENLSIESVLGRKDIRLDFYNKEKLITSFLYSDIWIKEKRDKIMQFMKEYKS